MSSFDKFLKDLEKESNQCLSSINNKIKSTGEVIYESLLGPKSDQGTPKITGHLRSNWIITIDSKYDGVVGSKENVDTSLRNSKIIEFLGIDDLYLKSNIFFNNNVEYGPKVNYGTDKIAPQYFREKAKQRGDEYLKANRK